ncbi:MAG: hypothetical protein ACJ8C3_17175 [Microvirga sp.]|jgi:hypothetical protein
MALKVIESEQELFELFVEHIKACEKPRLYNEAIVEFVDFLVREIPSGIDRDFIMEHFDCAFTTQSALGVLLNRTAKTDVEAECYPGLIEFAARLFEEAIREYVDLELANRLLIEMGCLGERRYFRQAREGQTIFLRETAQFRSKFKARVRIKQEGDYASYGLSALPSSKEQARLGW